jgi:hypothetical protein
MPKSDVTVDVTVSVKHLRAELENRNPPPPRQFTDLEIPPCSPSATFLNRAAQCVFACSPISMPM